MAGQPEWIEYLRALLALLFVVALIFVLSFALRRSGLDKRLIGNKGNARLRVVETLYLDPRHRLVIVQHDQREHLLLIGPHGSQPIATSEKSGTDAA